METSQSRSAARMFGECRYWTRHVGRVPGLLQRHRSRRSRLSGTGRCCDGHCSTGEADTKDEMLRGIVQEDEAASTKLQRQQEALDSSARLARNGGEHCVGSDTRIPLSAAARLCATTVPSTRLRRRAAILEIDAYGTTTARRRTCPHTAHRHACSNEPARARQLPEGRCHDQ